MIGSSSHLTSLKRMSCLGDHDICNSSVPCSDDGCHGSRTGKQLLICISQCFPNFFWSHAICGSYTIVSARTTLFQEK